MAVEQVVIVGGEILQCKVVHMPRLALLLRYCVCRCGEPQSTCFHVKVCAFTTNKHHLLLCVCA